ncbi:MAG: hypothetical protein ACI93R_001447 [Flavobacteriales bacterium]|jgi:hypothetical protein
MTGLQGIKSDLLSVAIGIFVIGLLASGLGLNTVLKSNELEPSELQRGVLVVNLK